MVVQTVRSLIWVSAIALLGAYLTACGGAGKGVSSVPPGTSSAAATPGTPGTPTIIASSETPGLRGLKGDEDDDDTASNRTYNTKNDNDADYDNDSKAKEPKTYYDSDDGPIRSYGEVANASDSRAIAALVKRYYAAAAAANGARACPLIYSLFAEAIPEDYGRGAGPAYSRGNTCAVVMSKLFKHNHAQLPAKIVVTAVRVNGNQARALIGSVAAPASYLLLRRERGVWKVDALLGMPLP
jgi:hypothetical protein